MRAAAILIASVLAVLSLDVPTALGQKASDRSVASWRPRAEAVADSVAALRRFLDLDKRVEIDLRLDGTLLLDFQSRPLASDDLQRVIFQLAHLPSDAYPDRLPVPLTGLIVSNTLVVGYWTLDDLAIPFSLTLQEVTFGQPTEEPERPVVSLENVAFERGLTFDQTVWNGRVHVAHSVFRNRLVIKESRFAGGGNSEGTLLRFDKNTFGADLHLIDVHFAPAGDAMKLYDSQIGASLKLERVRFGGAVRVRRNVIGHFEAAQTSHSGFLIISQNQIDQVTLSSGWIYASLFIQENRIERGLVVVDTRFFSYRVRAGGDQPRLEITLNEIGSELYFSPAYIYGGLDKTVLSHNQVGNLVAVEVPHVDPPADQAATPHVVDLSFSEVQGSLDLSLREREPRATPPEAPTNDPLISDYCYKTKKDAGDVKIDVKQARIKTLVWQLPVGTCRYRWSGVGLRFGDWRDSPPNAPGSTPSDGEALVERLDGWKYQMEGPDPTFFLYLSEKLRAFGKFEVSRSMLEEAKRLDYVPRQCTWPSPAIWTETHCVRSYLVYYFLYPTGFGAKPERALVFLLLSVVLGYVFYKIFSLNRRTRFMQSLWAWMEHHDVVRTDQGWLQRLYFKLFVPEPSDSSGAGASDQAASSADALTQDGAFRVRKVQPRGSTAVAGFAQYDAEINPKSFPILVFNLDAALPVVNFHAYDSYYPDNVVVRVVSYFQHAFGWWMLTVFVASLAIL